MAKIKKEKSPQASKSPIAAPWTQAQDTALVQMRAEGIPWTTIAERLGKKRSTCQARFVRIQETTAEEAWSEETTVEFRAAYQRKKGDMWNLLATEMGFKGHWKVLETKIFELGKKGLK